ncbi:unnamed protein product [Dibothriocephalus latus]|uniref:SH3 domain-containing protein n=1 Tax=Dibothriocephalus latus TaxID=60516 RepID=A0A3P7MKF2_DIBLA|nr:unnamed protein product [Dibothriocephalus latus]
MHRPPRRLAPTPGHQIAEQSSRPIPPCMIQVQPVTARMTVSNDSTLMASVTGEQDHKPLATTGTPIATCIALYDFKGHLPGDLSLKVGEKVNILKEKDGWYEGVSLSTHQSGMFPANYVEKLPSTGFYLLAVFFLLMPLSTEKQLDEVREGKVGIIRYVYYRSPPPSVEREHYSIPMI